MLIKDVIQLYDEAKTKRGFDKKQVQSEHGIISDFFAFVIDQDMEISFKDKRDVPVHELTAKESV